jgi:hypothetical protein
MPFDPKIATGHFYSNNAVELGFHAANVYIGTDTVLYGVTMVYAEEDWLCRYLAYFRSTTTLETSIVSPMDEIIDSLKEGYTRANEVMRAAKTRYGAQLMWIDIETLDRAGQWNAVGRFHPEDFE